jgi:hypothetical protein
MFPRINHRVFTRMRDNTSYGPGLTAEFKALSSFPTPIPPSLALLGTGAFRNAELYGFAMAVVTRLGHGHLEVGSRQEQRCMYTSHYIGDWTV